MSIFSYICIFSLGASTLYLALSIIFHFKRPYYESDQNTRQKAQNDTPGARF